MIKKKLLRDQFLKFLPQIFFIKSFYSFYFFVFYELILFYKLNIFLLIKNYKKNILDLKKLKFISSRSIFNTFVNSFYQDKYYNFNKTKIIYISAEFLKYFINKKLHNIYYKFVIIVGNSDEPVNLKKKQINKLIKNKLFLKLFAQNLCISHKKFIHIPIGVDFHTQFYLDKFGKNKIFPSDVEKKFIEIKKRKKKQIFKVYCDFQFNLNKARSECFREIPKKISYFAPNRLSQFNTWKKIKKFKFIACPQGNGLDTHRVWESILLGCIPIVKSGPLDKLYKQFPIIIIKKWSEINSISLKKKYYLIKKKKYKFKLLKNNYWIDKISNIE